MGKYHITKVELEHNHPLVTPTMVHMLPSHRKINEVQAHEIDLAKDAKATSDFMSLQVSKDPDVVRPHWSLKLLVSRSFGPR